MFERKEPAENNFREARRLAREFKCMDSSEISLLLQFCENNEENTRKILTVFESIYKPSQLLQEMLEHPERSDGMLKRFLSLYDERHEKEHPEHKQFTLRKSYHVRKGELDLCSLPRQLVLEIALFLQPYELQQFMNLVPSWTALLKLSRSKTEDYYKKICQVLFTGLEPRLPNVCMFENIRSYVMAHPLELSPNLRNYIETNVREYVWQFRASDLRLPATYFRSMGSFENVYNLCPRVNFNGCYVLKEKYVRPVEHGLNMCVQKYNMIHYYRYLRFVRDGSVLYTFSNIRLKPDQLLERLSLKRLTEQSETIKGEYMQHKDKLIVKIARCNTVFSFECTIQSQERPFDSLLINRFNLEIVDESYIVQDVYRDKHKEDRFFVYTRNDQLASENPMEVQSASL